MEDKTLLTKRELILDSITNLVKVKIKLENEIRDAGPYVNRDNLPTKLETVESILNDICKMYDVYFKY